MFSRYLVIESDVYTLNGYTPAFKFIFCGTSNFFYKIGSAWDLFLVVAFHIGVLYV